MKKSMVRLKVLNAILGVLDLLPPAHEIRVNNSLAKIASTYS